MPEWLPWMTLGTMAMAMAAYFILPLRLRFLLNPWHGLAINLLFAALGALLLRQADPRNDPGWVGNHSKAMVLLRLLEDPVEKPGSYKSLAEVLAVIENGKYAHATGHVLLYFSKEQEIPGFGTCLYPLIPLQPVRSSNNPGAFDYSWFCLREGITHQVFLKKDDYRIYKSPPAAWQKFIHSCRNYVLGVLGEYILSDRERGLAEALLIGYRDDLDKSLAQAYANTGVVHIIAISGLHLGLIYTLLLFFTRPLKTRMKWIRLAMILCSLWLFTIIAGAQPSVMRAAVMFSFMATGEVIARQTNSYNSLALSAFILLCLQPFWLWDPGFQLSFLAVLSIVTFYRPVYNLLYFKNPLPDFFWKLLAVTLSAQMLTTPAAIFHFHQFPLLFILTNLVAVPLASLILTGEVALCMIAFLEPVAAAAGRVLQFLIAMMNSYIERLDSVSFATLQGLYISGFRSILLTLVAALGGSWLMHRHKILLIGTMACLAAFMIAGAGEEITRKQQQKMIVYQVPGKSVVEIISGKTAFSLDGASMEMDGKLYSRHIAPSMLLHGIKETKAFYGQCFRIGSMTICVYDDPGDAGHIHPESPGLVILTGKAALPAISARGAAMVVADGSVRGRPLKKIREQCSGQGIPFHSVAEDGCFQMDLRPFL